MLHLANLRTAEAQALTLAAHQIIFFNPLEAIVVAFWLILATIDGILHNYAEYYVFYLDPLGMVEYSFLETLHFYIWGCTVISL